VRFLAAAAALLSATTARADASHPKVGLTIDPCVGEDAAAIRRAVSVELGALLVDDPGARDVTRVGLTCDAGMVLIAVADPVTGKTIGRRIALASEAPAARSRLVALAVAEAVVASWVELEASPAPEVRSVDAAC
jgi:hypothetical protein